jgi:hypothetical protein
MRRDEAAHQRSAAGEGAGEDLGGVAEDPAGHVADDQQQADEDADMRQHRRVLHRPHQQPFHQHADDEGHQHGGNEGDPVGDACLHHRPGDEGRERGHLALREIHVMRGLIDHHQGQRDRGIDAPRGDAGDDLMREAVHASQYPR